jgi:hypothetical protein
VWSTALIGCGTVAPAHPVARPLPLTFAAPELRTQLMEQDLLKPFTAYWTAHTERDWATRFKMERPFTTDIKETFYIAYHNGAWAIQSFEVVKIYAPDDRNRVRIDVKALFQNPQEPAKTNSTLVQDWWVKENTDWQHINTDPMLNGLKAVL